jgi:hypothetical protein
LIGWVTVRQLRVRAVSSDQCVSEVPIADETIRCTRDYSRSNEDQQSYLPEWIDPDANQTNLIKRSPSIERAFQYRSSKQMDTYLYVGEHATYASGGYLYECRGSLLHLRQNLSELHRLTWIDDRTRAVLIQMSLYNPNVEMFTSVTLLMEFLSTGNLVPTARFEPIELQSISVSLFLALRDRIFF